MKGQTLSIRLHFTKQSRYVELEELHRQTRQIFFRYYNSLADYIQMCHDRTDVKKDDPIYPELLEGVIGESVK